MSHLKDFIYYKHYLWNGTYYQTSNYSLFTSCNKDLQCKWNQKEDKVNEENAEKEYSGFRKMMVYDASKCFH